MMNMIVAVDSLWGIGYAGGQLVEIPEDRRYFREETQGHVIVMGRKTLNTFPQGLPLPNRTNIILSTNPSFKVKDGIVVHSLESCLELLNQYKQEDIFVVGGEEIYRLFLPYCDTVHVTYIDYQYRSDRYFPNLDKDPEWVMALESEEQTYFDLEYTFRLYKRKR